MRITGGKLGGLNVKVSELKIAGFRPTMDFLRASLFSSLSTKLDFNEIKVLDIFSGTGVMSFECISRGANKSVLIESNPKLASEILNNAVNLKIDNQLEILPIRYEDFNANTSKFRLVIADPPYGSYEFREFFESLLNKDLFDKDSCFVFEDQASNIKEICKYLDGQNIEGFVLSKAKVHGESGYIVLTN